MNFANLDWSNPNIIQEHTAKIESVDVVRQEIHHLSYRRTHHSLRAQTQGLGRILIFLNLKSVSKKKTQIIQKA